MYCQPGTPAGLAVGATAPPVALGINVLWADATAAVRPKRARDLKLTMLMMMMIGDDNDRLYITSDEVGLNELLKEWKKLVSKCSGEERKEREKS